MLPTMTVADPLVLQRGERTIVVRNVGRGNTRGDLTLVVKGMDLEATRKAVDLAAFRERFTKGDVAVGRAFDAFFVSPAVERA